MSLEDDIEAAKNISPTRVRETLKWVWATQNGDILPVQNMSHNHMCMSIGLWLKKEFIRAEILRVRRATHQNYDTYVSEDISPLTPPVECLTTASSFKTTPALITMLERLRAETNLQELLNIIEQREEEALLEVWHQTGPDYAYTEMIVHTMPAEVTILLTN